MNLMQKLRNKKGFTLIEIIVVLVILAILAAATIPSMLGFVNDARGKAYVAEARVGLIAAQAVVTEAVMTKGLSTLTNTTGDTVIDGKLVYKLTSFQNMTNDITGEFSAVIVDADTGRVSSITYKNNGWQVVLPNGGVATVTQVPVT